MEAIILAGGKGTRLSHIISAVPKPMAPINGEPFLKFIFEYLLKNKVTRVVLAVGYKHEYIKDYFCDEYQGISIMYSLEASPLGTGGAIKKAMEICNEKDVFILNGDTFFDVDLIEMKAFHEMNSSELTIAVKELNKFDRYGAVVIEDNVIKEFVEKKPTEHGKINGGTYLLKKEIFVSIEDESFSFEKTILESGLVNIYAYESGGYFIDIGVPEDYYKSQMDLISIFKKTDDAMNKAVFLDRDGTINVEKNYLYKIEDFVFIEGSIEAIKIFHDLGYKVILITNQAGVARGYYSENDVEKLHNYIDDELKKQDTYIDAYYFCPHHIEGIVTHYAVQCECRKPKIGMIEKAVTDFNINLADSIIVGDKEIDVQTGKIAGIKHSILVRSGHSIDESNTTADEVHNDLITYATLLEKRSGTKGCIERQMS